MHYLNNKNNVNYIKLFLNTNWKKKITNRNKNYDNSNKTKLKELSVSNIRDIAFYGCSEIIWTKNSTIFTVFATNFGEITAAFNCIEHIDHFT